MHELAAYPHLPGCFASHRSRGFDLERLELARCLARLGDRYIERAPKYWLATRARMDAAQLALKIGWLTIPPPPAK